MTITHDFTEADFQTYLVMLRRSSAMKPNRPVALFAGIYFWVGFYLLGNYFQLSTAHYFLLLAFILGLIGIFIFSVRSAARKQIGKSKESALGLRQYTIGKGLLELKLEDITQLVAAKNIRKFESTEHGTMLHLPRNGPFFLPFGKAVRPDFIQALKEEAARAT